MSNLTGTIRAKATIEAGANPVIYNVTCTLANTEYSQVLNTGAKKITIRCRDNAKLQIAFTSGDSGILYMSIPNGCTFSEDELLFSGTLYFQASKPNVVVEILEWT